VTFCLTKKKISSTAGLKYSNEYYTEKQAKRQVLLDITKRSKNYSKIKHKHEYAAAFHFRFCERKYSPQLQQN